MGNTARATRAAILDFSGFALLLAGANALLAGSDPFWLSANPNPWLLLPVYLGCRYGFRAGAVAGFATAAIAAIYIVGKSGLPAREAMLGQRFLLLGFVVGGLFTGAVRGLLSRRLRELESRAATVEKENAHLRIDNDMLDETRHQLQQRLALFGAETCALDSQLRALFAPSAGPVLPGCLAILRAAAHVGGSCVVAVQADGSGKVIAALDSKWQQDDIIPAAKLAMTRAAIEARAVVTWKADQHRGATDFLAAIPWGDPSARDVVVLIEDMPFTALNRGIFVRIETIVRWVARFLPDPVRSVEPIPASTHASSAGSAFLSPADFASHGRLAQETYERLRLPSIIAEFEDSSPAVGNNGHAPVMDVLIRALGRDLHAPRVACLATDSRKLSVLLPMEGAREAEIFALELLHPLEAAGHLPPGRVRHQFIEIGGNGNHSGST